jgi:Tfp pilus assembly protein PilX
MSTHRRAEILNHLNNEKGMALVLVLMMMLLLSVLGTTIYTTSSTEMRISRNNRFVNEAFYAAERGIEYAQTDANIYSDIGTATAAVPATGVDLSSGNTDVTGVVTYLATGNPPRGSGVDITEFQANYFLINTTGTTTSNTSVRLENNVGRIIPRP